MDYKDNYKLVVSAFERMFGNFSRRKKVEDRRMIEQMRKLKAFHLLSNITGREDITVVEVCRVAVKSLCQSYKYPEFAYARIVLGDREYRTSNYQETPWNNSAPVIVNDTVIGNIETGYIKERPGGEDVESIAGELSFLRDISEHLSRFLRSATAEKEDSQLLEEHL